MGKFCFENKVAVITGSSMGIGRETAYTLAEKGAKIVLNGRNIDRLNRTHREMEARGIDAICIPGDVSSREACKRLIEKTIDHFGRIDFLINNAGLSMRGNFSHIQPEVFKKVVDVNILGTVYASLYALPHLMETMGSLVFISSLSGITGLPESSAYCASKMGLTGLAESLRLDLAATGIHVGIIYIGFVQNDPEKRVLSADGTLKPLNRPYHITQKDVAQSIARVLQKRKYKVVLTPLGKIVNIQKRICPWLVYRELLFFKRRVKKMLS
jgi:short-subunit dehydrogenase